MTCCQSSVAVYGLKNAGLHQASSRSVPTLFHCAERCRPCQLRIRGAIRTANSGNICRNFADEVGQICAMTRLPLNELRLRRAHIFFTFLAIFRLWSCRKGRPVR